MRAQMPYVEVPGDNEDHIMSRSGDCLGMSATKAVWRFGFLKESPAAKAYGVYITIPRGFLWVLVDRLNGDILDTWKGVAYEMPKEFRNVLDWEG